MSIALCQLEVPAVNGLNDAEITVGRHLSLKCQLTADSQFNFQNTQLKADDNEPFTVKIFKIDSVDAQNFSVDLTFYRAGEVKLEQIVFTDGTQELSLTGPSVKVASVLPPPAEDGKPPVPYNGVLPLSIGIPILYFGLAAVAAVVVIGLAILRARTLAYYRQLKNKLKSYQSPVAPDSEFYRSVRAAEREHYPLAQLEKAFRLYVLRTYQLPMFDLADAEVLRYFRRVFPRYKTVRLELAKILGEFEEQRTSSENPEEREALVKKLYRFVEKYRGLDA